LVWITNLLHNKLADQIILWLAEFLLDEACNVVQEFSIYTISLEGLVIDSILNLLVGTGSFCRSGTSIGSNRGLLSEVWEVLQRNTENAIYSLTWKSALLSTFVTDLED